MHHAARREHWVLAVIGDRHAEHASILQCAAHQMRIGDRCAVVGEGDSAYLRELCEVGEFLARAASCDAGDRQNANGALRLRHPEDELDHAGGIDGWFCVGHRADGCEAAAGGGQRPAGDRFLVLKARLA